MPISGQINLMGPRDAGESSNAGTLHHGPGSRSQAYSRVARKGHTGALTRGASGSRSKSGCRKEGVSSLRHGDASSTGPAERKRCANGGQGPSAEALGLYQ